MPHPITFEPATAADADALAALRVEAMRESLLRIGRFDAVRARTRFLDRFDPAHTQHILVDGQRVGFYALKPDADGWVLHDLYVLPEHQGRGVGTAALHRVFAAVDAGSGPHRQHAAAQASPLRVGALRESEANAFYLRHGFEPAHQTEFDNHCVRHPVVR